LVITLIKCELKRPNPLLLNRLLNSFAKTLAHARPFFQHLKILSYIDETLNPKPVNKGPSQGGERRKMEKTLVIFHIPHFIKLTTHTPPNLILNPKP
jgi:hypothetical protein